MWFLNHVKNINQGRIRKKKLFMFSSPKNSNKLYRARFMSPEKLGFMEKSKSWKN